jgi:hypothetical protein
MRDARRSRLGLDAVPRELQGRDGYPSAMEASQHSSTTHPTERFFKGESFVDFADLARRVNWVTIARIAPKLDFPTPAMLVCGMGAIG